MRLNVLTDLYPLRSDALCCLVWEDERPLRGLAGALDFALTSKLSRLIKNGFFTGKPMEQLLLFEPKWGTPRFLFWGMGLRLSYETETHNKLIQMYTAHLEKMRLLQFEELILEIRPTKSRFAGPFSNLRAQEDLGSVEPPTGARGEYQRGSRPFWKESPIDLFLDQVKRLFPQTQIQFIELME